MISDSVTLTLDTAAIRDIDGNVYHAVVMGTQVWMLENLKTTRFNDGSVIPLVTDNGAWGGLTSPGYCWYKNDSASNNDPYGVLYNWYAVNTGKLAPAGWHVASDSEWGVLSDYLGSNGLSMILTGSGGFSARLGGERDCDGVFGDLGSDGFWWTTTPNGTYPDGRPIEWYWLLPSGTSVAFHESFEPCYGYNVRCIRDQ